jgi:superfamily I DNA/RNA helicase
MENTWSKQQKTVFEHFASGKGNLVVRARAGTGKTTTILEACNHAPKADKILLAAFNKRIATELTNRVSAPNVEAKTLHSLGFAYIRRQWNNLKIDGDVEFSRANEAFGGADAPDEMVRLVAKLAGLLKNVMPLEKDVEKVKELATEFDLVPEDAWEEEGWSAEAICETAVKARDLAKVRDEQGRISFDDMIFIPIANDFARAWYDLVVIDEAQDMNYAQLLLAQRACKKTGRVVVVGDDRQAIYGFRGADAGGLDRLKQELGASECGLTTTYRCAKSIVRQAGKYVGDFQAADTNPEGIVDRIPAGEALIKTAKPGDFVLSRANAPLMPICLAFLKKGIKARIEGRDVAATLRTIVNGFKAKSVPNFIERVEGWREKQTKRTLKIKKESVKEAKIDVINDQADMLAALADGCVNVAEILNRVNTLFGDSEEGGAPQNAIVCSSVHRAKGLEADRVFVLEETIRDNDDEECNIAYVAYTRAKKHLTLVGERKPKKKGRGNY